MINSKITIVNGIKIDKNDYSVEIEGSEKIFPKKEFELLAYLAFHPGKVFTRDHLLDVIWGEETYVVDRTVDVHVGRIRKKLGDRKNLIQTVVGVGYKFTAEN